METTIDKPSMPFALACAVAAFGIALAASYIWTTVIAAAVTHSLHHYIALIIMLVVLLALCALSFARCVSYFSRWVSAAKMRRNRDWWKECAEEHSRIVAQGARPHRQSKDPAERACAIWADEVMSLCKEGLTAEEADIARSAGVGIPDDTNIIASPEPNAKRFEGSILSAVVFVLLVPLSPVGPAMLLTSAIAVGLSSMSCVDLSTRMIPIETSAVLTALAIPYSLCTAGASATLTCIVFSLALVLACTIANKVMDARGFRGGMGIGDIRTIPAIVLCCGPSGLLPGAVFGLSLPVLIQALVCRALRKGWPETLAMAPYLALWAAFGMALPPLLAALS